MRGKILLSIALIIIGIIWFLYNFDIINQYQFASLSLGIILILLYVNAIFKRKNGIFFLLSGSYFILYFIYELLRNILSLKSITLVMFLASITSFVLFINDLLCRWQKKILYLYWLFLSVIFCSAGIIFQLIEGINVYLTVDTIIPFSMILIGFLIILSSIVDGIRARKNN